MQDEDHNQGSGKKKTQDTSPPPDLFGEPGTPASIPEDRVLTVPPDVEAEEEAAKDLLHQAALPAEKPKRNRSKKAAEQDQPTQGELDELEQKLQSIASLTAESVQKEINDLLAQIEEVGLRHAQLALMNGYGSISRDLKTLVNTGRHVSKRLPANAYWVK